MNSAQVAAGRVGAQGHLVARAAGLGQMFTGLSRLAPWGSGERGAGSTRPPASRGPGEAALLGARRIIEGSGSSRSIPETLPVQRKVPVTLLAAPEVTVSCYFNRTGWRAAVWSLNPCFQHAWVGPGDLGPASSASLPVIRGLCRTCHSRPLGKLSLPKVAVGMRGAMPSEARPWGNPGAVLSAGALSDSPRVPTEAEEVGRDTAHLGTWRILPPGEERKVVITGEKHRPQGGRAE